MAKAEPIATNPLATARQLWRLNKQGRLEIKPLAPIILSAGVMTVPISAAVADEAIRAGIEYEERLEAMRGSFDWP